MRRIDCAELVDLAPELALGNLCGDERAAALAHLAACPSCQEVVTSFTTVTDRLLQVAPRAEPPTGFEQRVLAALPSEVAPRRRRPRQRRSVAMLAAAAALALAFIAGGLLLNLGADDDSAFADAEMRTASGEVVGEVVLHHDDQPTLFMTLPGWAEQVERLGLSNVGYTVRIETDDGDVTTEPVTLTDDASWATSLDVDAGSVATVALVGADGYVWCEATFGPDVDNV
jgi:hypothetical protein